MLCLNDSIRHHDPSVQRLLSAVEEACSLTTLVLAAWQVGRLLAVHLIEAVLAARRASRRLAFVPQVWRDPAQQGLCYAAGDEPRGPIQWRRRIGRCPQGCAIAQVAPLDEALGVQPHQRTSGELPGAGMCPGGVCAVCDRGAIAGLPAVAWSAPEPCGVG